VSELRRTFTAPRRLSGTRRWSCPVGGDSSRPTETSEGQDGLPDSGRSRTTFGELCVATCNVSHDRLTDMMHSKSVPFMVQYRRVRARLSHAATAGVIALSTAGCATVPPAGLHLDSPLTEHDGAIIVRIVPNAPSAGPYFKSWGEVYVTQLNADGSRGTVYAIPASLDASSRSALFVASLPQGRYRFSRLSTSSYSQYGGRAQWIDVSSEFPSFDVSVGHLTDVGAIVQTFNPADSHSVQLTYDAHADHAIASEMIRELSPRLSPLLAQPILGWSSDRVNANARALGGMAARVSVGITDPHSLPDGELLSGSYDGIVKSGYPGRPASWHDIGQRVSIETVANIADGSWVAAGEFGVICRSTDGGASWKSIRGDLPYGLVASVHEMSGRLVATVVRDKHAIVATTGLESGFEPHWTVIATYTLKSGRFWESSSGYAARSVVVGGQLVTTLPADYIGVWNPSTGQSIERRLPGTLQRFAAPGNGMLRFMAEGGLFANASYISSDLGVTWEKVPPIPFIQGEALPDALNGMAWSDAPTIGTGWFEVTADGGRTWKQAQRQDSTVARIVLSADRKRAYAPDANGNLWVSDDVGQNWTKMTF
jgi:hypothetical protein